MTPTLPLENRIIRFLNLGLICLVFCFKLHSQCTSPHTISVNNNETELFACADSKPFNVLFFKSDTSQLKYAFVIADAFDNISRIQSPALINFGGPTLAIMRVWGIAYTDSLIYTTGSDVSTIRSATGCVRLSENVITVHRDIPFASNALFKSGSNDTAYCFNNATRDTIVMKLPENGSGRQSFVITLFDGTIVDIFQSASYVIDSLPRNIYFIYNVAYTGDLIAQKKSNLFNSNFSTSCFSIGQKSARIEIDTIHTGNVIILTQRRLFCPMDDKPDLFSVELNDGFSSSRALVLLDDQGICRKLGIGTTIDLNTANPGNHTINILRYSGRLLINIGDTIDRNSGREFSSDCHKWVSSPIDITIEKPNAGRVTTSTGDTLLFACPGDRLPDRIIFDASQQSPKSNYKILIVNNQNKIIANTDRLGFIDFEGLGTGSCRAYGFAYTGVFLLPADSSFNKVTSDDCYDLSDNFLTINKATAKGGSVSVNGGAATYYVCPQNDSTRKINFERKNNSNSPYQYVLTSETGTILDFVKNDSLSFRGLNNPSMRIYGVAFSGKRIITKGSNLFVSSFSDGCYSISDNFIRVVKDQPNAGGVRLANGFNKELFCPSDPTQKILSIRNVSTSSHPYAFVLVDSTSTVIDIFANFSYNFDSLPIGQYFIFGVSYIGKIILQKGTRLDFSTFSDDCFNYTLVDIEIIINEIDGGTLTTSEGTTNVYTCPSNLDPDIITMIPVKERALGYRYAITNEQNIILGYSFDPAIDFGIGAINSSCKVFGIAFKGNFTGVVGRNVFETAFSNSCYDLSDNFVRVVKAVPPAHRLITSAKDSIITICIGDSQKDTFSLGISDSSGFKKVFMAVENGKIIKLFTQNKIEFEKDSAGTLTLYSVIYTGKLLVREGLTFSTTFPISDDCFALSGNALLIDKVKTGPFCVITGTVDESDFKELKIFPNPTANSAELTVEWSNENGSKDKNVKINIYDLTGRKWQSNEYLIASAFNRIRIPVNSLATGLYIFEIESNGSKISRKVVIEN